VPDGGAVPRRKAILTEFVAYLDLGQLSGSGLTREVQELSARSLVLLTYALCGFSNFASHRHPDRGIARSLRSRRHEIARLGFKGDGRGGLATFMIACIAGTSSAVTRCWG